MPPTKQAIVFANNREATAVFPSSVDTVTEIIQALGVEQPKSVLLVIGGADNLDEKVSLRLTQLFGRGIARATANLKTLIIDGGTEAGVMKMMGQGVADRGFKSTLIGVTPRSLVSYPGNEAADKTPLDPNHSHFVLVEGEEWGSETGTIFKLMSSLAANVPSVVLLAGGGAVSKNECLQLVRQNLPLIIIEGSGGMADEIAAAWKAKPELPDDPVMAEIVDDGRMEFHQLSKSLKGAERLVIRALGGDNVLLQAWERFADYDMNALLQQRRFQYQQMSIVVIGVVTTFVALLNELWDGNQKRLTFERWWPALRNGELTGGEIGWTAIHYLLLASPIIVTILISAANRFKQGNKWLLLRAGAEAIKREIFRFRAGAIAYAPTPEPAPATSESTPVTPALPPAPTPEQVLAQRVEDITRRVMRTEVNSTSLIPYDKSKGFPPHTYAAGGGDDGFSLLTPDRYVEVRLADQLRYYRSRAVKLEKQLKWIQWAIYIIGGVGTFLAAINRQVWIALTTALATALTTYLSYQQTENTLTKYNQAATDLDNVKSWWTALPAEDQAKQDNVDALVEHTEKVLQSELDGWVQQMQDALAELRKGQESAPEKEEPGAGGGPPDAASGAAEVVEGETTPKTEALPETDAPEEDLETVTPEAESGGEESAEQSEPAYTEESTVAAEDAEAVAVPKAQEEEGQ